MSLFQTVVRRNKPKRNVNQINVGSQSQLSVILQKNGRAWAWGNNNFGQLGDNTLVSKCTPVSVAGAIKTFCKITGGTTYLAIDKNGRAWGWGFNNQGQIGDNTIVSKLTPVSVAGAVKTFCQINNRGNGCVLAIDKNGRAWAWGFNGFGQIGDNTIVNKSTPVSVAGTVKTFCKISSGINSSLALDKNGRAWAWGNNTMGVLGDNTIVSKSTPVSVAGAVKTFCEITSGGNYFSLALDKNGRAWAWGNNTAGSLGDNTIVSKSTPVSVAGAVKTFCKISAGIAHVLAIDKNGRAWAWGSNDNGRLGDNTSVSKSTPVSVAGAVKTFCEIAAGNDFSLAVDKNGRAWAWGSNGIGQTGNNEVANKCTPQSIAGPTRTFCTVGANVATSFAIDKNGKLWGWGANGVGQIGDNSLIQKISPVGIAGSIKTFCKISSTLGSFALDKNGRAWAWGNNNVGQLGDNTVVGKSTPVSVAGAVKTFCEISGGNGDGAFSLAIDKNGRAWAWGYNGQGRLGDNTVVNKSTPVSVAGAVKTFCKISAGANFSLAIDKNGRAWAWGSNGLGSLGDNTTVSKSTPVSVVGAIKTFCKIVANVSGGTFSAAIDKNGRVWTWGYNAQGQLGDNTVVNKSTPVSVAGAVKTFCEISLGESHVVALDKNGRAWAWGNNISGTLGDKTIINKSTPVSVAGAVKTFCKIIASAQPGVFGDSGHTLAIDKNGRAWAWGPQNSFCLGVNVPVTPVQVCNI